MDSLNGIDKIAVLLAALGEEAAAKVLAVFDEDEQSRIGQAMVELEDADLDDDVIVGIVDEFKELLRTGGFLRSHLGKTLASVLEKMYGEDEGRQRLGRIRKDSRSRHPFRALRGVRSTDLARVLLDEHPQIQALVLANLDSEQAAAILEEFPDSVRTPVVTRMAVTDEPSVRLLKHVAQKLIDRARGLRREERKTGEVGDPRHKVVADILNATEAGVDKEILETLDEENADMSASIRERMFSWDDLGGLDKKSMQKILAGIETKVLALALKSSSDEVRDCILGATSQRTKDMIMEERELLGAVPLTEVLDAQKSVLTTVRELMDSGELVVSTGSGAQFVS